MSVRTSKRDQIREFFGSNLGEEFGTLDMHMTFGTAFRARVSEINRDDRASFRILNRVIATGDAERSYYWAETKTQPEVRV